jgi:hypothetical protein
MRHHLSVMLGAAVALAGCGSIEKTASMQQPMDKALLAGPGDVVLRIDRERSLANVAGKADIWGRKTNEGFTEVRFAGVEPDGQVVLYRKDVEILSNETTLTRQRTTTETVHGELARQGRHGPRLQVSAAATGTTELSVSHGAARLEHMHRLASDLELAGDAIKSDRPEAAPFLDTIPWLAPPQAPV